MLMREFKDMTKERDCIRVYRASFIECCKCDNWEQGDRPWSAFTHHDETWTDCEGNEEHGFYTCNSCGTSCVKEGELDEYRDFE